MAIIGVGAKLEYELGSTWTEVPHCKSVGFPQFNVSQIDTTHLGITDNGMTSAPGMVDPGTCSFEAEFSESVYTALGGLVGDVMGWRVSSPSAEDVVVTCDGYLSSLNVNLTPNDEVMISGEVKFTGIPVIS